MEFQELMVWSHSCSISSQAASNLRCHGAPCDCIIMGRTLRITYLNRFHATDSCNTFDKRFAFSLPISNDTTVCIQHSPEPLFDTEYDVNYTLKIYATNNNVHSFSYQHNLFKYTLNHYIRIFKINLYVLPSRAVPLYRHMIKPRQNWISIWQQYQ